MSDLADFLMFLPSAKGRGLLRPNVLQSFTLHGDGSALFWQFPIYIFRANYSTYSNIKGSISPRFYGELSLNTSHFGNTIHHNRFNTGTFVFSTARSFQFWQRINPFLPARPTLDQLVPRAYFRSRLVAEGFWQPRRHLCEC